MSNIASACMRRIREILSIDTPDVRFWNGLTHRQRVALLAATHPSTDFKVLRVYAKSEFWMLTRSLQDRIIQEARTIAQLVDDTRL